MRFVPLYLLILLVRGSSKGSVTHTSIPLFVYLSHILVPPFLSPRKNLSFEISLINLVL